MKKVLKWAGMLIGCFVLLYGILVVMAMNRTATISVDYVAIINETAAAVPEDQRAWPFYREAGIALNTRPEPVSSLFYDLEIDMPEWPDQEGWSHYADWLKHHKSTIALIHQGTALDGMGFVTSGTIAEEDRKLWPDQYKSEQTEEPHDGSMIGVLLPQLSHMRSMARLLMYDAKVATSEGDNNRCLADIESMLRLAVHVREHPLLINDLVSLSIFSMAFATVQEVLEYEPNLFNQQQSLELMNQLHALDTEFEVRFDGERMFMYDLAQRIYTDDGNGDGSLIISNMIDKAAYMSTFTNADENKYPFLPLLSPITDFIFASRKELITEYDRRLDGVEANRGVPLYEWYQVAQSSHEPWDPSMLPTNKYFFINLLMPALQKPLLLSQYARAHRSGVIATLYATSYHKKTGNWPITVAGAGVLDGWTGKPLLIATIEGNPVIYSTGVDQDDDGGRYHEAAKTYHVDPNTIPDGDWVFYAPTE